MSRRHQLTRRRSYARRQREVRRIGSGHGPSRLHGAPMWLIAEPGEQVGAGPGFIGVPMLLPCVAEGRI